MKVASVNISTFVYSMSPQERAKSLSRAITNSLISRDLQSKNKQLIPRSQANMSPVKEKKELYNRDADASASQRIYDKFLSIKSELLKPTVFPMINNIKAYHPSNEKENNSSLKDTRSRQNQLVLPEVKVDSQVEMKSSNNKKFQSFLLITNPKAGLQEITRTKNISNVSNATPVNASIKQTSINKDSVPPIKGSLNVVSTRNHEIEFQDQQTSRLDFEKVQSKNLEYLKKLNDRYYGNKLRSSSNEKHDTSIDRLNKIKKFFKLSKAVSDENQKLLNNSQSDTSKFLFKIDPGNNGEMIKKCMQHRINWAECPNYLVPHFHWAPLSSSISYKELNKYSIRKQMVNHFEFHSQLSNKLNLFANLMKYCELRSIDIFSYMPLTILIHYDSMSFLRQFESFSHVFNHIQDFISPCNIIPEANKRRYADFFYLDFTEKNGNKTNLYVHYNHYAGKNLWLVKAVDMNRGRCIKIADSVEKVGRIIKKFYKGVSREFNEGDLEEEEPKKKSSLPLLPIGSYDNSSVSPSHKLPNSKNPKYRSSLVILQKYIEKPLLYKGRKFDLRLWVMLTNKLEVFAYKEGHLKASSEKFDINNLSSFIHLTNYSVQKYNENFSKFEEGNEISFQDFQNALDADNRNISVRHDIFPKMCEIIKVTMSSVREKINVFDRQYCFEIFGYDFIFDCELNPMLLEINTNPGLDDSSKWIMIIMPRMIDDAFRLTIDEVFGKSYSFGQKYQSLFQVPGYTNEENLWEFVCNIKENDEISEIEKNNRFSKRKHGKR